MKSEETLTEAQEDRALGAYFALLALAQKAAEPLSFERQFAANVLLKAAAHIDDLDAKELLAVRAVAVLSEPVAELLEMR